MTESKMTLERPRGNILAHPVVGLENINIAGITKVGNSSFSQEFYCGPDVDGLAHRDESL